MRRKKTRLICQNPDCRNEYEALRLDSKFCCPACRTAAYRVRLKGKEKFQRLDVYYPAESCRLQEIRRKLIFQLKEILELDRRTVVKATELRDTHDKLHETIQNWISLNTKTIWAQIEWIFEKIETALILAMRKSESGNSLVLQFSLSEEERSGVQKLLGLGSSKQSGR